MCINKKRLADQIGISLIHLLRQPEAFIALPEDCSYTPRRGPYTGLPFSYLVRDEDANILLSDASLCVDIRLTELPRRTLKAIRKHLPDS